jgi:maltose O-acetyltransferase
MRTSVIDEWVNRSIRYPGAVAMRLRVARLRALGMQIGHKCWVRRIRVPRNPWDIAIEDEVALDDDVVLLTTGSRTTQLRLNIGKKTYVNRFSMFDASERIEIGCNCLIGPFCYVTDHDHNYTSALHSPTQPLISSPVVIDNDVWLGAGVIILKGVTIGRGAVIGAGAVVTRSVAPNARVAGVPARSISADPETDICGRTTGATVARK